jgi:hypothetical protein
LGCTQDVPVDWKAFDLVHSVARMSFIRHRVAVMPDFHWGTGAMVGGAAGQGLRCAFAWPCGHKPTNARPVIRCSIPCSSYSVRVNLLLLFDHRAFINSWAIGGRRPCLKTPRAANWFKRKVPRERLRSSELSRFFPSFSGSLRCKHGKLT